MITLWRDPRRLGYGAVALLVLAVAALSIFYAERRVGELGARFTERAEFFALALADRAALYLSQEKQAELKLLVQTVALGNVLYVQIAWNGQLIDERGPLAANLQLDRLSAAPSSPVAQRRSSDGLRYLEIIRPLPRLSSAVPEGYIRVGTALAPLEREIRGEILFIAGLSLLLVAAGAALILYLSRPPLAEREPTGAAELPVSEGGVEQPEGPPLQLDDAAKRVLLRGREVELSPREYELLKLLASAPGRVFSNQEILDAVWKGQGFATTKDVKQYVYLLRRKLEEDPQNPELILTVRGFGYKLNPATGPGGLPVRDDPAV
ncbi:MAG: winged helix-turn-helix domain-containing protein [Candidatus Bipolaricaulia bacterium]